MVSNPKVWFLTYDGKTVVLSSRELATQRLWQIQATEQTNKTPQLLKQTDWETLLSKLQSKENLTVIPADPETTNKGKLKEIADLLPKSLKIYSNLMVLVILIEIKCFNNREDFGKKNKLV